MGNNTLQVSEYLHQLLNENDNNKCKKIREKAKNINKEEVKSIEDKMFAKIFRFMYWSKNDNEIVEEQSYIQKILFECIQIINCKSYEIVIFNTTKKIISIFNKYPEKLLDEKIEKYHDKNVQIKLILNKIKIKQKLDIDKCLNELENDLKTIEGIFQEMKNREAGLDEAKIYYKKRKRNNIMWAISSTIFITLATTYAYDTFKEKNKLEKKIIEKEKIIKSKDKELKINKEEKFNITTYCSSPIWLINKLQEDKPRFWIDLKEKIYVPRIDEKNLLKELKQAKNNYKLRKKIILDFISRTPQLKIGSKVQIVDNKIKKISGYIQVKFLDNAEEKEGLILEKALDLTCKEDSANPIIHGLYKNSNNYYPSFLILKLPTSKF